MKSDPLTGTLVGVLAVSALASIFFFYSYVSKVRELRQTQQTVFIAGNKRQFVQNLVVEVLEYSKTHPAIDPVLEQLNLKQKPGGAATPAPSTNTKPASK